LSIYTDQIEASKSTEKPTPDKLSTGAVSNWIETDKQRLRVVTYPPGYEADHTCYSGHAFYIVSGKIDIKHEDEVTKWEQGDSFIIPDEVPHVLMNPYGDNAKIIVVDHG